MKELSKDFMSDLQSPQGTLYPILDRVHHDQTLMLAIRNGYINIYYRGGNILKVSRNKNGSYEATFDVNYCKSQSMKPLPLKTITTVEQSAEWVAAFPELKRVMDEFFCDHEKPEREFQQLVVRENNKSSISNETEYFISDIEAAQTRARFDMLAIRWLANQKKDVTNCIPAFIEVKYGDGALDGTAGMLKHLTDISKLISNKQAYSDTVKAMEGQFNQLYDLGLLKFNKSSRYEKMELRISDQPDDRPANKPEVIFILANHNPRSTKLRTILADIETDKRVDLKLFNLKFFVASFAGYGLHEKCMLPLDRFRELVDSLCSKSCAPILE